MEYIQRAYNYVFFEASDPRVKDWPMMQSPIPVACIVLFYLTMIKLVLPAYMRNRKAYDLRTAIRWYNVVQIVGNVIGTWGILTSGWTTSYTFFCPLPDYSDKPEAMWMLRFLWWTFVLKLMEFCETAFFILRKKEQQASFLHIWHHVTSFLFIWAGTKYVGGGLGSFPPLINNFIHVIMYTYYLLSADGSPTVKATLAKYKNWLTIVQMVQFTVMLIYTSQVYLPSCPAPIGVTPLFFPNVIFIYYMFYDFYQKNYVNKRKASLNIQNGKGTNIPNGNRAKRID